MKKILSRYLSFFIVPLFIMAFSFLPFPHQASAGPAVTPPCTPTFNYYNYAGGGSIPNGGTANLSWSVTLNCDTNALDYEAGIYDDNDSLVYSIPQNQIINGNVTVTLTPLRNFRFKVYTEGGVSPAAYGITSVNIPGSTGPTVDAGPDQTQSYYKPFGDFTLNGSAVGDGITNIKWTIESTSSSNALLLSNNAYSVSGNGLQEAGNYTFRLTVTDKWGQTGFSETHITVTPGGNKPPNVNAGTDKTVTLPDDTITLTGTASDDDGTIDSIRWTQIGGGSQAFFSNAGSLTTTISHIGYADVYTFRLTVIDNSGGFNGTSYDDVQVVVSTPSYATAPDLQSTQVSPSGNRVMANQPARFVLPVYNYGRGSTGTGFTNLFQLSHGQDGSGPISSMGTGTVRALDGVRTTITMYDIIDSDDVTSPYHTFTVPYEWWSYRICADNDASFTGTINEGVNEDNNCSAWQNTWVDTTSYDMTATPPTPKTAIGGVPTTFTSNIQEADNSIDVTTYAFFEVSDQPGGNHVIADKPPIAIPPPIWGGSSKPATLTYTFPAVSYMQIYSLRACADLKNLGDKPGEINEFDENNNCSEWSDITVMPPSGMSGTLNPPTATCTIPLNGNSCNVTLTWNVVNPVGTTSIAAPGMTDVFAGDTGTQAFPVPYNTRTFSLYNNGVLLDSSVGTASCAGGTTWDTTKCAVTPPSNGVDLVAAQPVPSVPLVSGTAVSFSSLITNSGTATTGVSFPNLFQVAKLSDQSDAVAISVNSLPPLNFGTSNTVTSSPYTFTTPGTYYLRTCADNDAMFIGAVTESNELNNCSTPWKTVTVAAAANIDLSAWTPVPNNPMVSGTTVTVSSEVYNNGTAATPTSFPTLFQIATLADGSDASAISVNPAAPLTANGGANWREVVTSTPFTLGAPGTYYFRTCADNNASFTGVITETIETNNCSDPWQPYVVTAPAAGVDLTAGSPIPNSLLTAGASVTFSAEAYNSGTGSTGVSFPNLFQVATLADGSDATAISVNSSPALTAAPGPGSRAVVTSSSYTLGGPGTYYFRMCADNNASFVGVVAETNELNNCGAPWTQYIVTNGSVSGIDLTAAEPVPNDVLISGTSVTFSSLISNIGTNSTGAPFPNLFQISTSPTGSSPTTISVNSLVALAGGSTNTSTTSPYTLGGAGLYYVRACADNTDPMTANGVITETNELNNCSNGPAGWKEVTVITGASVPTATLSASPTTIGLGGSSTLTWSSTNADKCNSDFFAGNGATSGSKTVSPTTSTVYNIVCSNSTIASVPATATVTVTGTPPPSGGNGNKKPKYVEN